MNKNEITQIQPNSVTNARHSFSEIQENILTLMVEAIQKHMSNEKDFDRDLFGNPRITINSAEFSPHKKRVWNEALDMKTKGFEFEFRKDNARRNTKVAGALITTVYSDYGSAKIDLVLNPWAIPYLLYWGKGVGGTIYSKAIALKVPGVYSKRLYKLCKRYENVGGFQMSLLEFKQMLEIEDKYKKLSELKKMIERANSSLKDKADVYFNYKLTKTGGSRSFNQISFAVHGIEKEKQNPTPKTDLYSLVYNVVCWVYPSHKDGSALTITDKIAENLEDLEKLYFRFKKLKAELDNGDKDFTDCVKLVKYILKEDYNI